MRELIDYLMGMREETSPVAAGEPGTSFGARISVSSAGSARSRRR